MATFLDVVRKATKQRKQGWIAKHYGPGPHPGTGTPQSIHAGARQRKGTPKAEKGKLPVSKWDGKSKKLTRFRASGGQEFQRGKGGTTDITRYGDLVFVGSKYGANRYGRLYTTGGKYVLVGLSREPITGRVKAAKQMAQRLARLTDWSQFDNMSKPQIDALQNKVMAEWNKFLAKK